MSRHRDQNGKVGSPSVTLGPPEYVERINALDARDAELATAIQRSESGAIERFVARFHRLLLAYVRMAGFPLADRDELAHDVLEDVVLGLQRPGARRPKNLRLHVVRAFRNRLLQARRDRARRERVVAEAARDLAVDCDTEDPGEVVVGCSHGMVRESHGPGWEPLEPSRPLEALWRILDSELTAEERSMVVAVADNVPQRQIAQWLGVPHAAARKRLQRVRLRLMGVAVRHADSLEPESARELTRFLSRCRAYLGAASGAEPAGHPPQE